jgi:hypothetical protein
MSSPDSLLRSAPILIASVLVWCATAALADDKPPPTVTACKPLEKQAELAVKNDFECGDTKGSIKITHGPLEVTLSDKRTSKIPDALTISYTGKNCQECVWVQFIWRKVIATVSENGKDVEKTLEGKAVVPFLDPKTGKETDYSYPLTVDEKKEPKWNIDSPHHGSDPTMSGTKGCAQAADCNANIAGDMPTSLFGFNTRTHATLNSYKFDAESEKILPSAKKFHVQLHAEDFLVCAGKICAKVVWDASWTIDVANGKVPDLAKFPKTPTYSSAAIEPGGQPTDAQKTALNDQFKGQTVIK